jgi:hypothetical protein
MFLSLEHLVDGYNVASLTVTIMQTIFINGSNLNHNFLSTKLMSFGIDGVSIFQGCYISVII